MDTNTSFTIKALCHDKPILVLIPHEDDEINLAGALICETRREQIRVICVFVTNGDWEYPGSVRIDEAVRSLHELHVPAEDIIFLGYPDGGLRGERAVMLHGRNEPVEVYGNRVTYGTKEHEDFAFIELSRHHEYTWRNLLSDMEQVILKYHPSLIAATDFDFHPDHRMCSIAFEQAMGHILYIEKDYRPLVFKGFCYSTGFESIPDFYGRHFYSSLPANRSGQVDTSMLDNPTYRWEQRVRLPVCLECRKPMRKNSIFKALSAHISQKAFGRADKIINSDEVFWLRRTDNLAYQGKLSASSGDVHYLADFMMMNSPNVGEKDPTFDDYLWTPAEGDREKWCRIDFEFPKDINNMSFYGNVDRENKIQKGLISFSNGYTCEIGPLADYGRETAVHFPEQKGITWIQFKVLEASGSKAGLSEWEIFDSKEAPFKILQITVDGHFAYSWHIYGDENPVIGAYTFGVDSEDLEWAADGKLCTLNEINLLVKSLDRPVRISACLKQDPSVRSTLDIGPASISYKLLHSASERMDHLHVWLERQREKRRHHRLKRMRRTV